VVIPGVNLLDDFAQMFRLFAKLLTIVFVISAFLFVMIEQGIMSLAAYFFNSELLAVGRLLAGAN
jgi:hypothetical protein